MTENLSRRMGEFLRIVISYLWDKPAGASTREIMAAIARAASLTAAESSPDPNLGNYPNYEVLTRSAMTALEKAGWLVREKNRWLLTREGQLVCRDFRDASDFYTESQRVLTAWQLNRPAFSLTIEYAKEKAWEQIQGFLQNLPHNELRALVRDLLTAMGYHIEWFAPPVKTRGQIDMIAVPDPLRADQPRLVVQIVHGDQAVTAEALETLLASVHPNNIVLSISCGGFSESAREIARTLVPEKVMLMDLEKFVALWIKHFDGLTLDARRRFALEAVHFLSVGD